MKCISVIQERQLQHLQITSGCRSYFPSIYVSDLLIQRYVRYISTYIINLKHIFLIIFTWVYVYKLKLENFNLLQIKCKGPEIQYIRINKTENLRKVKTKDINK